MKFYIITLLLAVVSMAGAVAVPRADATHVEARYYPRSNVLQPRDHARMFRRVKREIKVD